MKETRCITLERRRRQWRLLLRCLLIVSASLLLLSVRAQAQGSIFGTVANSDGSTQGAGEISFYGYIDGSDDELRTESVVGAGYDSGNWFDDFQNYQDEAPGLPYAYHFFNLTNSEATLLAESIPNNSFQQENVQLAADVRPDAPQGLAVAARTETGLTLNWTALPDFSYHVYRRAASSQGSFFRVDDPTGDLDNPGVTGGEYVDSDVVGGAEYEYLIIPEAANGDLGIHSAVLSTSVPSYLCGDADGDGLANISDVIYLIQYIFAGGPAPEPPAVADVDCSGMPDISDAVYIIQYIFNSGAAPCADCP